ncbi:MAG: methyltransferase domain-containing protein [bacterium]
MPFEFDGEKYARASSHQKEWGGRIIHELHLRGDESVLDLGSGDGALTRLLASLVPRGRVLGIDSSRNMINTADRWKGQNWRFMLMDINQLRLPEQFDLIFSNATLHWIHDHHRILRRVYEHLRDGGTIRFNFAGEGNCGTFIRIVQEIMRERGFSPFFQTFTWPWYMPSVSDYEELLGRFAFREKKVWSQIADHCFPDAETMALWIDQPNLIPFLAHLDDSCKPAFRGRVIERMIAETRLENGTFFETFRRINVLAIK